MSKVPAELKYTKTHEWVRLEADGTVTVGISDHAQDLLGDIVFLDLPEPGRTLKLGEDCAVVESVKAASDIYSPLSGEITAVNDNVVDSPELVNRDAYGDAWLFRMKPSNPQELAQLLDAAAYGELIAAEEH